MTSLLTISIEFMPLVYIASIVLVLVAGLIQVLLYVTSNASCYILNTGAMNKYLKTAKTPDAMKLKILFFGFPIELREKLTNYFKAPSSKPSEIFSETVGTLKQDLTIKAEIIAYISYFFVLLASFMTVKAVGNPYLLGLENILLLSLILFGINVMTKGLIYGAKFLSYYLFSSLLKKLDVFHLQYKDKISFVETIETQVTDTSAKNLDLSRKKFDDSIKEVQDLSKELSLLHSQAKNTFSILIEETIRHNEDFASLNENCHISSDSIADSLENTKVEIVDSVTKNVCDFLEKENLENQINIDKNADETVEKINDLLAASIINFVSASDEESLINLKSALPSEEKILSAYNDSAKISDITTENQFVTETASEVASTAVETAPVETSTVETVDTLTEIQSNTVETATVETANTIPEVEINTVETIAETAAINVEFKDVEPVEEALKITDISSLEGDEPMSSYQPMHFIVSHPASHNEDEIEDAFTADTEKSKEESDQLSENLSETEVCAQGLQDVLDNIGESIDKVDFNSFELLSEKLEILLQKPILTQSDQTILQNALSDFHKVFDKHEIS